MNQEYPRAQFTQEFPLKRKIHHISDTYKFAIHTWIAKQFLLHFTRPGCLLKSSFRKSSNVRNLAEKSKICTIMLYYTFQAGTVQKNLYRFKI